MTEQKYPVFISYAMEDGQSYAENLQNVLNGIGMPAFVAHKTIPIGYRDPSSRMLNGVDECRYFVLILTPAACKSIPVQKEIEKAIRENKQIIACKRQDVPRSLLPNDFLKNDIQRLRFENAQSLAKQVVHILVEMEKNFLVESGINRVFLSRHDPEYTKELTQCFTDENADEILMLGLTLREWFGKESESKYSKLLESAVQKGTKIKVLIVDPTSETTKERALAEKVKEFANDQTLLKSVLFKDMKKVLRWLQDPHTDNSTKKLIKDNVEARFYSSLLSVYIIKTSDYMFIEQYHTGKLGVLNGNKIDDIDDWCHGGYVPIFMIRNKSDFGRLMTDHFNNMWEKNAENNLDKIAQYVNKFELDPQAFRIRQFVEQTKKKCYELKIDP